MSAPFRLAWLLLVAGMVLFVGGSLPLGWPTSWAGVACLVLGILVTALSSRDRDDPRSTDGAFRGGVFVSMLLTPTVVLLIFAVLIGFCGLIVGLIAGFGAQLLLVCIRMLLMAMVVSFVTGIPAYASLPRRTHS